MAGGGEGDCIPFSYLRVVKISENYFFFTLVTGILWGKKKKACTIILGWETKPNQALWIFFVQNLPEPLIC